MNIPPVLNAFSLPNDEQSALGSIEASAAVRLIRPLSFALWIIVLCVEAVRAIADGGGTSFIVLGFCTLLFAGVHVQFWYEESERGRSFHRALDRMRGRIYEDEATSLPNSRHFVFELRRQMMRSVRNGRGFSLVLTDIGGYDRVALQDERVLPSIGRALRHALGDGDFVAHLQGPIFAAVISDDRSSTTAEKADNLLPALGSCIPNEFASQLFPVVSLTGYEGETEVRDFLRRAQRDLSGARAQGPRVIPTGKRRSTEPAAA